MKRSDSSSCATPISLDESIFCRGTSAESRSRHFCASYSRHDGDRKILLFCHPASSRGRHHSWDGTSLWSRNIFLLIWMLAYAFRMAPNDCNRSKRIIFLLASSSFLPQVVIVQQLKPWCDCVTSTWWKHWPVSRLQNRIVIIRYESQFIKYKYAPAYCSSFASFSS